MNNPINDERIETESPELWENNRRILMEARTYLSAYEDVEYLSGEDARPIRIQSEVMKPEYYLRQYEIRSTVIVFGSARFLDRKRAEKQLRDAELKLAANPKDSDLLQGLEKATHAVEVSKYYELAREFSYLVSRRNQVDRQLDNDGILDYVICTGGGPGIMEAANRGAYEAGAMSIGLNITLPYEQQPNPFISPQLCFNFHYFAIRKLHFMLRAKALVVCPGGFGTLDELFEALTLRQTEKMQKIPIVMFGREFWEKLINMEELVRTEVIDRRDLELFKYAETPEEAWKIIQAFHQVNEWTDPAER